jgi:hypothetical protein
MEQVLEVTEVREEAVEDQVIELSMELLGQVGGGAGVILD